MKKLKVITVLGTRPEVIRLSRIMQALDCSDEIEHLTIHTGQNYDYELNELFYNDLGIRKPDYFLNAAGDSAAATIGRILIGIDPLLEETKPDALLVLGDTNSCLSAIAAKKRQIPIFHIEAGNRCFDQRVPEETNRKIVDHISDINMTYSDIAREYLLREGISPDRIIKIGSPMFEVLNHYMPKIEASDVLERLQLAKGNYFVVSAHREENIKYDRNFFGLLSSLDLVCESFGFPVIVSTHPRTRKRLDSFIAENPDFILNPLVQWLRPLGFCDYNALQMSSFAVMSDSGTISEEASILNFRALNIREAHERPEAMEEASVMMVGLDPNRIIQGLTRLKSQNNSARGNAFTDGTLAELRIVSDYSMPNVSEKVVRIIISYTEYINRVVWSKI